MSSKIIYYFESVGIGGDSKYLYELMNNMSSGGYDIKCFCNSVVAEHLRQNVVNKINLIIEELEYLDKRIDRHWAFHRYLDKRIESLEERAKTNKLKEL